jgi:DNA-binding protein H-NS
VLSGGLKAGEKSEPGRVAQGKPRRKYPRVLPKYRNPLIPSQTWSGRGKRPRWLVAAMKSGQTIEDFQIDNSAMPKSSRQRARGSAGK